PVRRYGAAGTRLRRRQRRPRGGHEGRLEHALRRQPDHALLRRPTCLRRRADARIPRRPLHGDRHEQGSLAPMADTLRTLVAVDTGVDMHEITSTVATDGVISVVGIIDGLDDAWRALQDSSCDVLVVACQGYSERALIMIDAAAKQDRGRP